MKCRASNLTVGRSNNPNIPQRSQPSPATLPEKKIAPPKTESTIDESDQQKDA